jgi:hypothetical protein
MSAENEEQEGEFIDAWLRYLRGRGPRPGVGALSESERLAAEELAGLLEAIVDTDETSEPALEDDPVAIELGLVPKPLTGTGLGLIDRPGGAEVGVDPIDASLRDLGHRFSGELEVQADRENGGPAAAVNGYLPARAICRTLGEVVLVCTTDRDDFSDLPRRIAHIFLARPTTTAVAMVSTVSLLAVVLTEAECVRAIDPAEGWVDPGLPLPPAPLDMTLGRYLELSLPRWDEVTRLDTVLALTGTSGDISASVATAMDANLNRNARISAKKLAVQNLHGLSRALVEEVVEDVRAGRLRREELISRIGEISREGQA